MFQLFFIDALIFFDVSSVAKIYIIGDLII